MTPSFTCACDDGYTDNGDNICSEIPQGRRIPENETVMTGITMYPDWEISIDLLIDVGPEDTYPTVANRAPVMLFHFESGNPTGLTPLPTGYSPPSYWGYMIPGVHERGLTN